MQGKIQQIYEQIISGSFIALARGITIVENELDGYEELLMNLKQTGKTKVVVDNAPTPDATNGLQSLRDCLCRKGKALRGNAILLC